MNREESHLSTNGISLDNLEFLSDDGASQVAETCSFLQMTSRAICWIEIYGTTTFWISIKRLKKGYNWWAPHKLIKVGCSSASS